MHPSVTLIRNFYTAFQQNDYKTMQAAYHPDATYSDPVFGSLNSSEAKAMWKMLITSAKDLKITFGEIEADDNEGTCRWQAHYTFTGTSRKVHNIITSHFIFKDGKIFRQEDKFNFWRWSWMALGSSGLVMGWSPYLLNAVQKKVKGRLLKYMEKGV